MATPHGEHRERSMHKVPDTPARSTPTPRGEARERLMQKADDLMRRGSPRPWSAPLMKSKVPETLSQFMEESSGDEELETDEKEGECRSACGIGPASLSRHPRWDWEPG